jgi:hypothetical protein
MTSWPIEVVTYDLHIGNALTLGLCPTHKHPQKKVHENFFILTKDTSMDSKLKSCNRKELMFAFMTWVVVHMCVWRTLILLHTI